MYSPQVFDSSTGTCSFYAGGCRTGSARRGRVLSLVAPTSRHLPHALHPDILPSPYYMVPAKAVGGPSVVTAAYGGGHRLVPDPVKIASEFSATALLRKSGPIIMSRLRTGYPYSLGMQRYQVEIELDIAGRCRS